ncbi:MAG TPA: hypothetical protein VFF03_06120 [Rhodocyclaceae bacterium]|nr:hypothetical protein [Rhodocyclaceae bacterium]
MQLRHLLRETSPRRTREEPDWRSALPGEWRAAAVAPLHIDTWREHEMPACRSIGYDEDEAPCYYRHVFLLSGLRSDDDLEYYEALVYGEEVQAWRLRDGRWLVWRVAHGEEDWQPAAGFYGFSEQMPR